jgi:SRSO17 transposase
MGRRQADGSEARFDAYVDGLASVIGHADREGPLRDYCTGLLLPGERKSVEPMAAITAPERVSAQHQSLLHFIGVGAWSDDNVMGKVREMVLPQMQQHEPIRAWIIDDTSFPKQGMHSVGVARQYCGRLGKQDNCQVAVSLSLANSHASLPVAFRLYLPKDWAEDEIRRRKAGVPDDITFKTKPEIALEQLQWAYKLGLPGEVVVTDAGYGANTDLRANITEMGMSYVAGILPQTKVWELGNEPPAPKTSTGRKRPGKQMRRGAKHQPVSVKELALGLPASAWRTITWREGAAEVLSSRFARVRVRAAHRDDKLTDCRAGRMAADRMAGGREGADQVLALDSCKRHQLPSVGRLRQAALAHRARLPGAQAGGGARRLRRTRMARFPPSCDAQHRGLWIPDLREGGFSPLKSSCRKAHAKICRSPRLSTPRLRRCGLSVTSRTPLRPCAGA